MEAANRRLLRLAVRECVVWAVASLAAYLFLVHPQLYLNGSTAHDITPANFLLTTAVLFVMIRLVLVVGGMFFSPLPEIPVICPECGRTVSDPSAHGIVRHQRVAMRPKPTEKEVLAAVMLRKAIDDARRVAGKSLSGPSPIPALPGDVENGPISVEEFERILHDLDTARRGHGSDGRQPKGPSPRGG